MIPFQNIALMKLMFKSKFFFIFCKFFLHFFFFSIFFRKKLKNTFFSSRQSFFCVFYIIIPWSVLDYSEMASLRASHSKNRKEFALISQYKRHYFFFFVLSERNSFML